MNYANSSAGNNNNKMSNTLIIHTPFNSFEYIPDKLKSNSDLFEDIFIFGQCPLSSQMVVNFSNDSFIEDFSLFFEYVNNTELQALIKEQESLKAELLVYQKFIDLKNLSNEFDIYKAKFLTELIENLPKS